MPQSPLIGSSVRGRKVYFPAITKARVVKQFAAGSYRAMLVSDCESVGGIAYNYVLYVRRQDETAPLLAMASELADINPDDGERFLCMFYQGRHYSYGYSSDWLDMEKFMQGAWVIASDQLAITDNLHELPAGSATGFNLPFGA